MMQMQDEERKGKWKEKLHSLVADEKYTKFIIIAGLAAIALIFISNFFDSGSKTQPSPEQTVYTSSQTALAYKQEIEASLQDIISSIEGAGTTKLYVTVDSGTEYVYAADEKESKSLQNGKGDGSTKTDESSDKEKNYITVRLSDGTEQAIVLKEIQPTVRGVVVVCSGGGDIEVQQRVLEAVTKALNISSAKVCVTKLSE